MKMNDSEKLLRETIRCILAESTLKVGDVKAALTAAKKSQNIEKAKAAAKEAGKKGIMMALNMIPGAGAIASAIEGGLELKDLYDAAKDMDPKDKKKNPLWDILTIDPETSAVVDDGVEGKFIKDLSQNVMSRGDNEDLPDADSMLKIWLKNKYSGTHIAK